MAKKSPPRITPLRFVGSEQTQNDQTTTKPFLFRKTNKDLPKAESQTEVRGWLNWMDGFIRIEGIGWIDLKKDPQSLGCANTDGRTKNTVFFFAEKRTSRAGPTRDGVGPEVGCPHSQVPIFHIYREFGPRVVD